MIGSLLRSQVRAGAVAVVIGVAAPRVARWLREDDDRRGGGRGPGARRARLRAADMLDQLGRLRPTRAGRR